SGKNITSLNTQTSDLTIKKLAMAIKLKNNWAAAIGLRPFSSSNYSFYTTKPINGTTLMTQAYEEGSGGLYQAYFANSVKVGKNLFLGLESAVIFGSLNQVETMTGLAGENLVTNNNQFFSGLHFTWGA